MVVPLKGVARDTFAGQKAFRLSDLRRSKVPSVFAQVSASRRIMLVPNTNGGLRMRLKWFAFALVTAGVAASVAVAAPPAGKGKPTTTGPGCKPRIMVVLKGTLAAAPGASATSISV